MTAFDVNGVVLGSVTSAPSPAAGTIFETLSFSGIGDISVVLWETDSPTIGSPGIDNLTFFLAGIGGVAADTALRAGSSTTTSETQRAGVGLDYKPRWSDSEPAHGCKDHALDRLWAC